MIAHENFDSKTNNFPANWHTDYESEFTVHLPLISINPSNTHTMYAVNTHTSLSGPPRNEHAIRNIFRSFGEKTDALMLDVDGWHQGRLEGSSPRIMVQFKYTRGNDLLLHPTEGLSDKSRAQIKRTKKHLSNYGVIKQRLKEDFLFAKNMHTLKTVLACTWFGFLKFVTIIIPDPYPRPKGNAPIYIYIYSYTGHCSPS